MLDDKGRNMLTIATLSMCDSKTKNKLQELGLSLSLSQRIITEIELAHIWGIDEISSFTDETGATRSVDLAGLPKAYSRLMIQKYLKGFLSSKHLNEEEKKQLGSLNNPFMLATNLLATEIQGLMNNKIPYMIFGGFTGHLVLFVLHEGTLNNLQPG